MIFAATVSRLRSRRPPASRPQPAPWARQRCRREVGYEIVELVEPELIVLRSGPMPKVGMHEPTITRVEFHDHGAKTRMTLSDGPYPAGHDHAEAGWTAAFDNLGRSSPDRTPTASETPGAEVQPAAAAIMTSAKSVRPGVTAASSPARHDPLGRRHVWMFSPRIGPVVLECTECSTTADAQPRYRSGLHEGQ